MIIPKVLHLEDIEDGSNIGDDVIDICRRRSQPFDRLMTNGGGELRRGDLQ